MPLKLHISSDLIIVIVITNMVLMPVKFGMTYVHLVALKTQKNIYDCKSVWFSIITPPTVWTMEWIIAQVSTTYKGYSWEFCCTHLFYFYMHSGTILYWSFFIWTFQHMLSDDFHLWFHIIYFVTATDFNQANFTLCVLGFRRLFNIRNK